VNPGRNTLSFTRWPLTLLLSRARAPSKAHHFPGRLPPASRGPTKQRVTSTRQCRRAGTMWCGAWSGGQCLGPHSLHTPEVPPRRLRSAGARPRPSGGCCVSAPRAPGISGRSTVERAAELWWSLAGQPSHLPRRCDRGGDLSGPTLAGWFHGLGVSRAPRQTDADGDEQRQRQQAARNRTRRP
jgi:hypothetical protein